jgi:hypothetical protein
MSIYTSKQTIEKLNSIDSDTALKILKKMAFRNRAPIVLEEINGLMNKVDTLELKETLCSLDDVKYVPYRKLKAFSESPVMLHLNELVNIAMRPNGPFMSRDIVGMLEYETNAKYYLHSNGINRLARDYIGYALILAGFEQASTYDKDRQTNLKKWRVRKDYKHLTKENKVLTIQKRLENELRNTENKIKVASERYDKMLDDLI